MAGGEPRRHPTPRRPRPDLPALVAGGLGAVGVLYRLVLTLHTVPASNSDEATFGLVALHVAQGRAHPVFLYGQRYMGVLESYLAAPLIAVTGPSYPVLRLPLLVLYALFVWLMYRLTRRVLSPWLAVLVVGLLALGTERVVRDQLTAVGGRPEVKVAVAAMLLVAVGLAEGTIRRRRLAVALFGLLAGLSVWSDWLILPYLAAAGLTLLYALRRQLLGTAGALLLAGFAVGAFPLLWDNLTAPPGQDSLSVLRAVDASGGEPGPLADRVAGTFTQGIPLAAGLCPTHGCAGWPQWFGLLYPVLLVAATGLALVRLRRSARHPIRPVVCLALVAGAALTLLGYARSPLAAADPLSSARYLSVLQLSLPAVLWPLWVAATTGWRRPARLAGRIVGAAAAAVLVTLVGTALVATGRFATDTAGIRAEERQARQLADTLRATGPRHVYGDYWTCHRLVFATDEQVRCGVIDDQLQPGQNRYPAYWWAVERAERPGYVLRAGSPAERRLADLLAEAAVPAPVTDVGDYRVYHPATPIRPWQ